MTSTTIDFDPAAALELADAAILNRIKEVRDRGDEEATHASKASEEYANHLASGGDPLVYPDTSYVSHGQASYLVNPFDALRVVYFAWNKARGSRNPIAPFRQHREWRVGELLAKNIGSPVSYADLADVYRGGSSGRPSSETIADIALRLEGGGDLVVRRTKLDGKVAYLVRERRQDDPPGGSYRASGIPEEA